MTFTDRLPCCPCCTDGCCTKTQKEMEDYAMRALSRNAAIRPVIHIAGTMKES